jgi:hypothetical protein
MRVFLATSCLFFCILMPSSGWAQLPIWETIQVAAQKAQPERYHVMATYEEVHTGSRPSMAIRIIVNAEGDVRLDTQNVQNGHTKSRVWALSPSTPAPRSPSKGSLRPPAWLCWLAAHPVSDIVHDKGIATSRVSLAHLDGTILWVVGAGPHDTELPQLHFERDSGRLRRAVDKVLSPEEDKNAWVEFEPSHDPAQRGWPKKIAFGQGTQRRVMVNTWLRFDNPPSASEFEALQRSQNPVKEVEHPPSTSASPP